MTTPTTLYRPKRIWGLACYTITPKGAEKLLKIVLPLRNGKNDVTFRSGLCVDPVSCSFPNMSLDTDVGQIHIDKIMARVVVPPIAVHRVLDNVSTIDFGREEDRANAQMAIGRFEDPVADYAKALHLHSADAHNNHGFVLHRLGRHEEAIASYDKALALRANHLLAGINRQEALRMLEAAHLSGKSTEVAAARAIRIASACGSTARSTSTARCPCYRTTLRPSGTAHSSSSA